MADRLHNLRTIDAMSRHKQIKIAAETSYIYAPLAHRLGLYNLKSEFMDICLKINEPELYTSITTKLKDRLMDGDVKIEIYDQDKKLVQTIPGGKRKGINKVYWNFRMKPPKVAGSRGEGARCEGRFAVPAGDS